MIPKADNSGEWAHNSNGVRGISELYGMGKPRNSTRHPVRIAMALCTFVTGHHILWTQYCRQQLAGTPYWWMMQCSRNYRSGRVNDAMFMFGRA